MEALAVVAVLLLVLRTDGRVQGPAGNVDIGRGVDVLQRFGIIGDVLYGDVSSTKEMVTHDIIEGADRYAEVLNVTKNHTNLLNITFCPDLDCLFDVYFDGFQVDLADKPWKLLTTSRSRHMISERFGVPDIAMGFGQKFVIVSYKRPVKRIKTFDNFTQLAELKSSISEKFKCMSIGIESMVTDFITEHGSHYIDEYTLGDTVFQVLVYLPVFYNKFYKCVLNNCSESDTALLLSPVYTEYQGQVLSVGSDAVEKWVDTNLQVESKHGHTYVSLYALKNRPELCNEIVALMDDQSVVGLHLKTMSTFIPEPVKRKWFTEVLDNHVKLREVNL
ncbi:torso-like protein [Aphis gossypii]|uniref:torso-like protein n=1 Tax=Aphis gossypii TaxID=80765 RepID=UPI0021593C4F|nr:torso-like protein [Aphis gossypii]